MTPARRAAAAIRSIAMAALMACASHPALGDQVTVSPQTTVPPSAALSTYPADSLRVPAAIRRQDSRPSLLMRRDVLFGAAAVASVALATRLDSWGADEAPESKGRFARGLSHGVGRLGDPAYVAPLLALAFGAHALAGNPERERSVVRIAASAATAGIATGAIKLAVGRARPYQTPGDVDVYHPFSGNTSFPSGHTAVAFALATAIDHETKAKWIPWVVYPLAGMVGWSRLRDDKHWTSDVVGGAVVGYWAARKVAVRLTR